MLRLTLEIEMVDVNVNVDIGYWIWIGVCLSVCQQTVGSGMIKVDAAMGGCSGSCHLSLAVCLSVFLSFCPSLPPFRPPVGENLGVERILGGSGGKKRSDMASLFRCNAASARECKEQCQVGVSVNVSVTFDSDWIDRVDYRRW